MARCFFCSTIIVTPWFTSPPGIALFSSLIGAIGIVVMMWWFKSAIWKEEEKGPYFILDKSSQQVCLPRSDYVFAASQIDSFQWWQGRAKSHRASPALLVLVRDSSLLTRYLILARPQYSYVRQLVHATQTSLDEYSWGYRFALDAECDTSQ